MARIALAIALMAATGAGVVAALLPQKPLLVDPKASINIESLERDRYWATVRGTDDRDYELRFTLWRVVATDQQLPTVTIELAEAGGDLPLCRVNVLQKRELEDIETLVSTVRAFAEHD